MKLLKNLLFVLAVSAICTVSVISLAEIFNEMSLDLASWITPIGPDW